MKMDIRTIRYKEVVYLRLEDITALLSDYAATEETDSRNRMEELIKNIEKLR